MAQGKWSEVEARGVLEGLKRSGLPLERFAKERGIVAQRLRWRKKKFSLHARAAMMPIAPPFLPVRVAEAPRRAEPVTVLLGTGHMLKVSRGGRVCPRRRAARGRVMLGLPPSVRIYLATELADMRKGIDGLRAIVEGALRQDPFAGHLFVFGGKSRDKVKILFWDRSGFVLYLKRLEKGRFQLPVVDSRRQHVTMEPPTRGAP